MLQSVSSFMRFILHNSAPLLFLEPINVVPSILTGVFSFLLPYNYKGVEFQLLNHQGYLWLSVLHFQPGVHDGEC